MVSAAPAPPDVAQVRFDNAMLLFDEFVQATVRHPDAAVLRGLERRFAEQLLIQPSYWSQIKARSRQIGERLARQFESRCRKPHGWMDQPHDATPAVRPSTEPLPEPAAAPSAPQDDDERFIVGLVLSYYRRHPQRARARLLDLLGEVLTTPPPPPPAAVPAPGAGPRDEALALWQQSQRGVQPLKKKRP